MAACAAYAQNSDGPISMRDYLEEAARIQQPGARLNDRNHTYGENSDFGSLSSNDSRIPIENYNNPAPVVRAIDAQTWIRLVPDLATRGVEAIGNVLGDTIVKGLDAITANQNEQSTENVTRQVASNAVRMIVDQNVNEGCDGRGGTISPDSVYVRDLNGDGVHDLIIAHDGIVCSRFPQQSIECGAQVCTVNFYLFQAGRLEFTATGLALVTSISNDEPPVINLYLHGGSTASVQWNGAQFANR